MAKHTNKNVTPEIIEIARDLIRRTDTATLATVRAADNGPYASWVLTACAEDGAPLLYLSDLAVHAGNIAHDPRASLLYMDAQATGMRLADSRITVNGTLVMDDAPALIDRYMDAHEDARPTRSFADFHLYRMAVESAHLVAGFGEIFSLGRDDLTDG